MTTPKTTVYDSMRQCSSALGIPLAKLKRAKALGCPAFANGRVDAGKLKEWLASRKAKPATSTTPAVAGPMDKGTPANLAALEQAAARLWADYEAARQSGDLEQAAVVLRSWLDTSEQLRRFDRDVSANRRSGQESIPRSDIEGLLEHLIAWWATALRRELLDVLAPNLAKCESLADMMDLLEPVAHRGLFDAVGHVKSWTSNQPKWLLDAVEKNLRGRFTDAADRDEKLEARVLILSALGSMSEPNLRECLAFIQGRVNSEPPPATPDTSTPPIL